MEAVEAPAYLIDAVLLLLAQLPVELLQLLEIFDPLGVILDRFLHEIDLLSLRQEVVAVDFRHEDQTGNVELEDGDSVFEALIGGVKLRVFRRQVVETLPDVGVLTAKTFDGFFLLLRDHSVPVGGKRGKNRRKLDLKQKS